MLEELVKGYAALWCVDAAGFGQDKPQARPRAGKRASAVISAAAVAPSASPAVPARPSQIAGTAAKKLPATQRLTINDRLRALMGPVITEEELKQKVRCCRIWFSNSRWTSVSRCYG